MKIYPLFLYLLISQMSIGQNPAYWQLTDVNGLPNMTVYEMLQDSKGYIWMGTGNGLCRYDGKFFKTYSSLLLKDQEILDVKEDRYQRIWFTNLSSQLFYLENDTIKEFLIQEIKPGYQALYLNVSDHYIWVMVKQIIKDSAHPQHCLLKINLDLKKISTILCLDSMDEPIIDNNVIHVTGQDTISEPQYFRFEENGSRDSIFFHMEHPDERYRLIFAKDHQVFIANKVKKKHHISRGKIELSILPMGYNNRVIRHFRHIQENYWVVSLNGILLTQNLENLDKVEPIFSEINCNYIFEDRENNLWISTTGNGVIIIPNYKINYYSPDNSSLQNKKVFRLSYNEKQDKIFIGHYKDGVSVLDANGQIKSIDLGLPERVRDIDFVGKQKDRIRISSDYSIQTLNNNFNLLSNKKWGIKVLMEDTKENVWIGTSDGFYKIEKAQVKDYFSVKKVKETAYMLKKKTYALFEDFSKNIWIGTIQGIYSYRDSLIPTLDQGQMIPYNISDIKQTADSTIWATTLGSGLLQIKNDEVIKKWTTADEHGLNTNICNKLTVDGNHLWLATNKGIAILNWKTGNFETIDKTDGLISEEISDVLIVDDQVWLASPNGLIRFSKSLNHHNHVAPLVHLTSLKIWEKDTTLHRELQLNYDQNNIQLSFVGLGFRARGNISYKYRMSGVDLNWVYTDSRLVRYPSINPGNYQFEVFAINEDGILSKTPAIIKLNIAPPWWQTWWFRILAFCILLGIGSGIISWRNKAIREKLKKEQAYKDKLVELKQQALRSQMNPHFIFNSLNAIQQFLTTNDEEQAMLYLSRFARLIRLIFEQSKMKTITLDEEIELLELYLKLEKLRFGEKVNFQILFGEKIKNRTFNIYLPPLLIQPLVENAFKHGLLHKKGKGLVTVFFEKEDDHLICIIQDDGIGRHKSTIINHQRSKDHISSGIKTAKERLAIFNATNTDQHFIIADLTDQNNLPQGTKIKLTIKC